MAINDAFDEVTASTFANRKGTPTDNITGMNALYNHFKKKKRITEDVSGGSRFERPVILMPNTTVGNYSGLGAHNIDEGENFSNLTVDWSKKYMYVIISGDEMRQNKGPEKAYSLVDAKIDAGEASVANHMSSEIYSDGTVVDGLIGLQGWMQTNGAGTVGGINSALYTNWQNKYLEMSGTDAWQANIRKEFNKAFLLASYNATSPDLIVASNDVYNAYEDTIQQQIRYMSAEKADGAQENIAYKGADVIHDVNVNFTGTAERAYMLTTKHWELCELSELKWKKQPYKTPVNADGIVIPFLWAGAQLTKSRRTNCLLIDAA